MNLNATRVYHDANLKLYKVHLMYLSAYVSQIFLPTAAIKIVDKILADKKFDEDP